MCVWLLKILSSQVAGASTSHNVVPNVEEDSMTLGEDEDMLSSDEVWVSSMVLP